MDTGRGENTSQSGEQRVVEPALDTVSNWTVGLSVCLAVCLSDGRKWPLRKGVKVKGFYVCLCLMA